MPKLERIKVTATYYVELGNVKVPKNVLKQLKKAEDMSDNITELRYEKAYSWLSDNIKERDSFHSEYQIEDLQVAAKKKATSFPSDVITNSAQ